MILNINYVAVYKKNIHKHLKSAIFRKLTSGMFLQHNPKTSLKLAIIEIGKLLKHI